MTKVNEKIPKSPDKKDAKSNHIVLTSHPQPHMECKRPIVWGAKGAINRGPVIATTHEREDRNVIGTHSGCYSIYRALAIASGQLDPDHKADLTNTTPVAALGPHPSWFDPSKIVSLDPYGHKVVEEFKDVLADGVDILPSIAITKARIFVPELMEQIKKGKLKPDGKILKENGQIEVTKAAIEPVWHLPGIAKRFGCDESFLRKTLFDQTGGMFPELVTRSDMEVFLPPIGGATVYILGDAERLGSDDKVTVRVHDECNGSDVFGSDICTCRPYLIHGIDLCIEEAQKNGIGVIVYNRKEGRALGEVTKFLVYNARKRQDGGDTAQKYFERTECVAGTQDVRFQELMPDVLHWLGISKISRFVSMSNMKYDALIAAGIQVDQRVSIPEDMIPDDALVEMAAKKASGYFSENGLEDEKKLAKTKGRDFDDK